MNNYAYADNNYNIDNPFRGAANAMLTIQALKARQHQEAIENAMAAERLKMAQEMHIPEMEARRMQTRQSEAAIGEHNARLAEYQRLTQGAKNVQNIGTAITGAQNYPGEESARNLVNAQREVPGLMPQGQFDVEVPRAAALGPTAEGPGIAQFPGLPQAPDYGAFIQKLIPGGQSGIMDIMRGNAASTAGTSAEMLKPFEQGDQAKLDMFGRQVSPMGPMSKYQEGHIQQMERAAQAKEAADRQERVIRMIQAVATAPPSNAYLSPEAATAERQERLKFAMENLPQEEQRPGAQQTMQGVTPPYKYSFSDLEKEAMDAIARQADPEAVKKKFKAATGKDLVMPEDFDVPRPMRR